MSVNSEVYFSIKNTVLTSIYNVGSNFCHLSQHGLS